MREEKRWALQFRNDDKPFLLGRFCWNDGDSDEIRIRTFRTRKLAIAAKKNLNIYHKARPVRIRLTVTEIERGGP